jgi:RNA polymerase sigma factor (sigma-70 family)
VSERERKELAGRVANRESGALGDILERAGGAAGGAEAAALRDDESTRLVVRAQAGDADAREQLINRLLPLVSALARRFRTEGLDQSDLIQEGIVGVLRALERYDPGRRAVPFAAYASWWIRHALQDARSDFIRPFRLPPKALRQLSQLKSEHQRIYQAEQRSANMAELARRTSIDLDQATALAAADARVRSLDEPADAYGEVGSLGDLLADPLSAAAYEEVIDAVAGSQLRALLSRLTEQERDVVGSRFGFHGEAEKLVEIGERLGVSAERVRQIEERALSKLRLDTA